MRSDLLLVGLLLAFTAGCGPEGKEGKAAPATSSPRAASGQPAAVTAPPAATPERWMGEFPAYPGAVKFCDQHVSGNSMHITAEFYGTADAPETVAAFYAREWKGRGPSPGAANTLTGSTEDLKLSWGAAGTAGLPTCDRPPAATDRTVLVVSRATK
jgi:hypothetical protein